MMKFWNRKIELIIAGKKYIYDEQDRKSIHIDFDVPFTTSKDPDVADIRIYNLSDISVGAIIKDAEVVLNAGYGNNIGNIFTGKVSSIRTDWEGPTKVTTVLAVDKAENKRRINKTYVAGTKASFIMRELANLLGVKVVEIKPVNDITYKKGKVISGDAYTELSKLAKETKSKMYINKGQLYIRADNKGTETGFVLNRNTGLIGSPQRIEEEDENGKKIVKYQVNCLLNHNITKDSMIRIESKALNLQTRVLEGKHTSDFESELIVKP